MLLTLQVRRLIDHIRGSRKSLVGASFIIVQPLLLNALSLPVTAYIIATLGALDYGQWAVALSLVTATSIVTNLGLRSFFVRGVAQHPDRAPLAFAQQLGLRTMLAVAAGCLSVGACYALGYPAAVVQCTIVLALGAVFTASAAVVSDLLAALERLPSLATINFASGLLLTIGSALAMWFDTGLTGLAISYLLGPVVSGVLSLVVVHRQLFPVHVSWNLGEAWTLLKNARVLGFQLLIMHFGNQAENLLVPKVVGISAFGYFSAGTLLPRRLEVVSDGLNTAFYPVLARGYRETPLAAAASVKKLMIFMAAACIPVALLISAFAGPIAHLLFPETEEICRTVIRITVWWLPLIGLAYAMGYALNAAGREKEEAAIAIASTIASLVISVVLIVWFGLMGACYALVARAAIAFLSRIPAVLSTLRVGRFEPAILEAGR